MGASNANWPPKPEFDNVTIMGVLNATPDSFSDGGQFNDVAAAVDRIAEMIQEGADIIDVGGESTRPGANPVSVSEELDRVLPVIEAAKDRFDIPLSLDTSTPELIVAGASFGVDLINDVRALRRPGALEAAASTDAMICLMHMQGDPVTMQMDPQYRDLIVDINQFFTERIADVCAAGINRERLILDPGFGFGKTPEHNQTMIRELVRFSVHELPVLVGMSRKSTLAKLADDVVSASVAAALIAVQNGASIVRVHDVKETVAAIKVLCAFA